MFQAPGEGTKHEKPGEVGRSRIRQGAALPGFAMADDRC